MTVPEIVTAAWIDSLSDRQLAQAEWQLRKGFATEETAEKRRRGDHYSMMRWPAVLMSAWLRWSLVSNEARARGVRTRYRA